MTKDRQAKQAARARRAVTGEPYTLARRNTGVRLSAAALRVRLVAEMRGWGWPVIEETVSEHGALMSYVGPFEFDVERADSDAVAVPDDPDGEEMAGLPLRVQVALPYNAGRAEGEDRTVWLTFDGEQDPGVLAAAVTDALAEARLTAVREAVPDEACGICDLEFPRRQMMPVNAAADYFVCPACVFDQDLGAGLSVTGMTAWVDAQQGSDPAFPAAWAAFIALVATLAPGPDTIGRLWDAEGALYQPEEHWSNPGAVWLWLPPVQDRPAALRGLRAGASLAAIEEVLAQAHPGLREKVHAEVMEEFSFEFGAARARTIADEATDPRLWTVAVAYVVAFGTQVAERDRGEDPYNVLESFEGYPLAGLIKELGSDWEYEQVQSSLETAIPLIAREVGFSTD